MVVDTSALICLLLGEPEADACAARLADGGHLYLSAGTWAEALLVAARRGVRAELERLVSGLGIEIVPVTASSSARVADVYEHWGKGNHPAALNFGDCFAFALARELNASLLYVGDAFAKTDLRA